VVNITKYSSSGLEFIFVGPSMISTSTTRVSGQWRWRAQLVLEMLNWGVNCMQREAGMY